MKIDQFILKTKNNCNTIVIYSSIKKFWFFQRFLVNFQSDKLEISPN
jgi:hypothetical protein